MIHFFVPGRPRTQGSLTFVTKHYAKHPDGLKAWRTYVRIAGRKAMGDLVPFAGPVLLGAVFLLERRRGRRVLPWAQADGDLDKYLRAIGDAGTGVLWTDDARIVGGYQAKMYANETEPGVLLEVAPATSADLLQGIAELLESKGGSSCPTRSTKPLPRRRR